VQGQETLPFSTASTPALGPAQFPIHCVTGANSAVVKRQELEAAQLPPSSAEVKDGGAIPPLLHMSSWRGAYLIMRRDNFHFLRNIFLSVNGTSSVRGWIYGRL
jgi:hypothetical protein